MSAPVTPQIDHSTAAGRLLQAERCSLAVIDIQEKLLPPIHEKGRLIKNTQLLLRLTKFLNIPVLVTTQYAKGLGPIVSEVSSLLDTIPPIDKQEFGCFSNEAFSAAARTLPPSRDTLILSGMETHICVLQTALGALAAEKVVHVAADAVGSRSEFNWKIGLDRMREAGAIISSTETILYELMGGSGTPVFKQMLPYLKS